LPIELKNANCPIVGFALGFPYVEGKEYEYSTTAKNKFIQQKISDEIGEEE
jgi:hypothetical protein